MADILKSRDVIVLAEIARAAQQSAKIAYIAIDGQVLRGTARAFAGNTSGALLMDNQDVRDAYLWVTLDNGFEAFPTIRYLMTLVFEGGFAIED